MSNTAADRIESQAAKIELLNHHIEEHQSLDGLQQMEIERLTAEVSRRDKVIEAVRDELKTAHRPHADSGFMISDYLIRQAIKKFDSGG